MPAGGYGPLDVLLQPAYRLAFYLRQWILPIDRNPFHALPGERNPFDPRCATAPSKGWGSTRGSRSAAATRPRPAHGSPRLAIFFPHLGRIQSGPVFAADRYTCAATIPRAALAAGLRSRPDAPGSVRDRPRGDWGACRAGGFLGRRRVQARFRRRRSHARLDSGETGGSGRGDRRRFPGVAPPPGSGHHVLRPRTRAVEERRARRSPGGPGGGSPNRFRQGGRVRREGCDPGRLRESGRCPGRLRGAIDLDPLHPTAFLNRGIYRIRKGEWEKALRDLDRRSGPTRGVLRSISNARRRSLGDAAGVLRDCRRTLELERRTVEAYLESTGASRRLGDFAGAVEDGKAVPAPNPTLSAAHAGLGEALEAMGDYAAAATEHESALHHAPADWSDQTKVQEMLKRVESRRGP